MYKEPRFEELVDWDRGADRRWKTFAELVDNDTPEGTWAYASRRNRYSADDKEAYKRNLEYGQRRERASGSGDQRSYESKRQRR